MLSTESANVGSPCLICTPLEMSKWISLPSTITEQDFVSLTLVQRSHVIMWLNSGILMIRPIKGAGGWYSNEVICICSSYHGEFPPEGPSEERREHCEVLDPQEICSKGIDPLNNSYMTDVMIIAEFLLLGEWSRVQRWARRRRTDLTAKPAMKWDWSSDAKRAHTFKKLQTLSVIVLLCSCVRWLWFGQCSKAKQTTTTTACVGYAPVLTAMSHLTA